MVLFEFILKFEQHAPDKCKFSFGQDMAFTYLTESISHFDRPLILTEQATTRVRKLAQNVLKISNIYASTSASMSVTRKPDNTTHKPGEQEA